MNLCPFCGAPIRGSGRFCPNCGVELKAMTPPAAPQPPVTAAPAAREPAANAMVPIAAAAEPAAPLDPSTSKAYRDLRMHLHQESKAWRFTAIGILVLMMAYVGFLICSSGFAGIAFSEGSREDVMGGAFLMGFSALYGGLMTLLILPVAIMGFVMGTRVNRYYEQSATDCTNAIKHADSVGVIVLGALFSTAALVFIIINFSKTKRNRAELEAVLAWQKAAGTASRHG